MRILARILLMACLALLPTQGWAAVAHDGEADKTGAITTSSASLTNKTTAGTNRLGVCAIGYYNGFYATTAPTWNGVSMTLAIEKHKTTGSYELEAAVYYIVAPPTAASTIAVSFAGAVSGYWGCTSFNGVNQGTPIGNTNTAQGDAAASPATLNISSSAGNMVVDATAQANDSSMTVGAGQTAFVNNWDGTTGVLGGGSYETGAGTVTMSWTYSGNHDWALAAVELIAASSGATRNLMLMGVGQ